jgi:hypothetical protein
MESAMKHCFALIALAALTFSPGVSPAQTPTAADSATVAQAAANTAVVSAQTAIAAQGIVMNSDTNVKDNVNIKVVLLPRKPAERIFGKDIARNYAVVQMTIDNESQSAAFTLQSVSMDYSQWALSGIQETGNDNCSRPSQLTDSEVAACTHSVSSVEYQSVRSELQSASTWSARNGIIRGLILVGSVASGITPYFVSTDAIIGASIFSGEFIPGIQGFWPDSSIQQMNNVSDLAYRTNTLVPKQSAEIVYGFFPIDDFLTPGLRKMFLEQPALFLSPGLLFADPKLSKSHIFGGKDIDTLRNNVIAAFGKQTGSNAGEPYDALTIFMDMAQQCTSANPCVGDVAKVKNMMQSLSLNAIRVEVGGAMTANTNSVPATIQNVRLDNNSSGGAWNTTCTETAGTLSGSYLTGGLPSISRIAGPGGAPLAAAVSTYVTPIPFLVNSGTSNDQTIRFSLEFSTPIPIGSTAYFQVTKYDPSDTAKAHPIQSSEFGLPVTYSVGTPTGTAPPCTAPTAPLP